MKVNNIKNINFRRNIPFIDTHVHDKSEVGLDENDDPDILLKFTRNNIDADGDVFVCKKVIPASLDCCFYKCGVPLVGEAKGNRDVVEKFANTNIENFYAVCQPKTGSLENIEKLFKNFPNKFVGLKFHPEGHEVMASDDCFIPYLKYAEKNKLPCLFHCGIKWENDKLVDEKYWYAEPEKIYEAAKKIPKTPVILAHLGGGGPIVHKKAIQVLKESIEKGDANLYVDISWVDIDRSDKQTIIGLIKDLQNTKKGDMTNKILFASDIPLAEYAFGKNGLSGQELYETNIRNIRNAIKSQCGEKADELIDKIFYNNADELFIKKNWANQ